MQLHRAWFPSGWQAESCFVDPDSPVWRPCGPGLGGRKSENQSQGEGQVLGHGRLGLQKLRQTAQDVQLGCMDGSHLGCCLGP